jgi:predicted MFS family arabinose efflux permease
VIRLALALFLMQAGFHGYTASMPLALSRAGMADSEIGLIVGVAALIQIPAALAAGGLIDWFGGIRLFLVGGLAYVGGSLVLLLTGADPAGPAWPFVAARVLQGVGIGLALPAALSVVPRLVAAARQGVALSIGGLSHNLTLVVVPPLSIIVLDAAGLRGVALFVLAFLAAAFVLTLARPFGSLTVPSHAGRRLRSSLRFTYRREWAAPLLITLLFAAHWGLVIAYLPQRAEAAGANVGLFFAADGVGVLISRVPVGWLSDRIAPLRLMLLGVAITAVGVALLLLVPTTALLVLAGLLTGGGAALITTPTLVALTRRSSDADRGSAFALFTAAFAVAIAIGSVGAAPIIDQLGFELTMTVLLGALIASAVVALLDRDLGRSGGGPDELAEAEAEALAVPQ